MLVETFKRRLFRSIGYQPFDDQAALHFHPTAKHLLALCGRRWGKSSRFAAAEAVVRACMGGSSELLGDRVVWCAAPTYELAGKVFFPTYRYLKRLGVPFEVENLTDMKLRTAWGSRVEGKSTDNPKSCVGEGVTDLIVDEFADVHPRTLKLSLLPTLLDRDGDFLGIGTPKNLPHVRELLAWGSESSEEYRPDSFAIRSPSWRNPHLDPEVIEELAHSLGGWDHPYTRQELGAELVVFAGLVYHMLVEATHYVEPPPLSEFVDFYGGIDWGYNPHPFVFVLLGKHRSGVWWVLREVHQTKLVPTDQADAVRTIAGEVIVPLHKRLRRVFCGPDEPGSIETLRRMGIPAEAADNAVDEGIKDVIDWVQADMLRFARPYVPNTWADFGKYRFPDDLGEGHAVRKNPIKRDDDGPDGVRYCVRGIRKLERIPRLTDMRVLKRRETKLPR